MYWSHNSKESPIHYSVYTTIKFVVIYIIIIDNNTIILFNVDAMEMHELVVCLRLMLLWKVA